MVNKTKSHRAVWIFGFGLCIVVLATVMFSLRIRNRNVVAEEERGGIFYAESLNAEATTYTAIKFDRNGGSGGTSAKRVNLNSALPDIEIPIQEGKIFCGYFYGDIQYYDEYGKGVKIWDIAESKITLVAKWSDDIKESIFVVFEFCGGDSEDFCADGVIGEKLPDGLVAPIREGYNFEGYYQYPDGCGKVYYDEYMVAIGELEYSEGGASGETCIYAYWTPCEYDAFFNFQGGESELVYKSVAVLYDQPLPQKDWLKAPTRTGYKFLGYYDDPNDRSVQYYNEDMQQQSRYVWNKAESGEIYAHWEALDYGVYLINPDCADNGLRIKVKFGAPMPKREPISDIKRGYEFMGYFSAPNGEGEKYYNSDMTSARNWDIANNDTEIYAYWKQIEYNITYMTSVWTGSEFENPNPLTYTIKDTVVFETIETDGVTIKWSPARIPAGTTGDIEVKIITVKTLTDNDKNYTVGLCNSEIIILPKTSAKYCTITVSSNVESLMIAGFENVKYNMNIDVQSSSENFILLLQNVIMQAGIDKDAIKLNDDKALVLSTSGVVEIYGGSSSNSIRNSGIYCGTLYIHSADSLLIQGGKGIEGAYASTGKQGGAGVFVAKNAVYINCNNVTIRGGKGGKGGDYDYEEGGVDDNGHIALGPGKGGKGGYPIMGTAQKITIYKASADISLTYEEGEQGEVGSDTHDYLKPDYPLPPTYPLYPPDPPIYIS